MMKVTPAAANKRQQVIHVVLVRLGVIGIADVDAERSRAACRRNDPHAPPG